MIPDIKKILYATDLTTNSVQAFRYAVNSAQKHKAKIVILHVNEALSATAQTLVSSYLTGEQASKIFDTKKDDTFERIRKRLEILCEKECKEEDDLMSMIDSIEVREGFPVEEILKVSDEHDCDVIVMGTHGKGVMENTFLGSTAKRVLRRTRKPIFVIPIPRGKTDISIQEA